MKKIILTICSSLVLLTSCVKDFEVLNTDPNNTQDVDPELLLKYSLKHGMSNFLTASHLEYNGLHQYMMYFATRGGIEPGNEYEQPSGADGFWRETYVDVANNTQQVINITDNDQLKAIAMIWKIYQMQGITDLYGDVPYSEAFKGNPELEFSPAYDRQEEIYHSFVVDLKKAVQLLEHGNGTISAEADLIYSGNTENWIRFAHSLLLRCAIRVNQVDADFSGEIITYLHDKRLIESNDQNATFQFNSVSQKPLYYAAEVQYEQGEQYINPGKYLVDLLVNSEDPRKRILFNKATLSDDYPFIDEYRGVPNLLPYSNDEWDNYNLDAQLGDELGQYGDVSRVGNWCTSNTRPTSLLSYAEVCFLKAEAALSGLWSGNAMDLLKEGITAHFNEINFYATDEQEITQQEINAYLQNIQEATLEEIITQKYIIFAYENVFEAYADFRRTGYPILKDYYEEPINTDIFPKRLKYPYSEYSLNKDNYEEAVSMQGADTQETKLWWQE